MAPKRFTISIDWLQENLFSTVKSGKKDANEALEELEKYLTDITSKHPEHIRAGSLKGDVTIMEMLNLSYTTDGSLWSLPDKTGHSPTQLLRKSVSHFLISRSETHDTMPQVDSLEELRFASARSDTSEAYARCALNLILVSCIAQEKRVAEEERAKDIQSQVPLHPPENRPRTPEPPAPVLLKYETELSFPVSVREKQKILVGKADYTLWYDVTETMGANLVVVEAKMQFSAGSAVPQLIAYMGIVHRTRKLNGKRNAVVYGIASDGMEFRFYCINNNSELKQQLRKSAIYMWDVDANVIISFIRFIIRAAILESLFTTPYSGNKRESTLSTFEGAGGSSNFDFITLPGDLIFEEPNDETIMLF
ncbi:hypothetical protein EMPG_11839 [Blastomyces silverae]|uniref:Uncharacterized protein n=1 Tax=Blastomyces silverae TaxID=2060906 RepID=A0A0H1BQA0_9EURO|nr:hypothetical protein EMPG_11839 [Blastomyces silverae]